MAEEDPSSRAHDLAIIVPIFGVLLLMPPLVGLFARPALGVFGIPLIVVYLFGLWFALIGAALLIALRLRKADEADSG